MTENASCRNPMCFLGSLRLEDWAQEASDRGGRGGQDKARFLAAGTSFLSFCLHIVFAQFGFDAARRSDAASDSIFFVFNAPSAIARNVREPRDRSAYADASISTLLYDEPI